MGVPFSSLLQRASTGTISELLGPDVVKLVSSLDPDLARPSALRKMLSDLRPPEELLATASSRKELLLLLKPEEQQELSRAIGLEDESLSALLNLNVRSGSQRETNLFRFFGVQPPLPPPPREDRSRLPATASYGLFAHQRKVKRRALEYLNSDDGRVLVHMPTGSGKTRTSMHLICEWLRNREPTTVLWLAHSEELCEQAASEFEDAWSSLGDREVTVHRFWGDAELDAEELDDGFIVAGLGKLYSKAKKDSRSILAMRRQVSLVVMDEAHQALAPTYNFLLDFFTVAPRAALLGLSATPGRGYLHVDEDQALAALFANNKVPLEIDGYDNPIAYLVDEGYLAKTAFEQIEYDASEQLSESAVAQLSESLEIPEAILKQLAADEQRSLKILEEIEDLLRADHKRLLVFATTVDHSRMLATVLRARGHNANHLSGDTPSGERSRIIQNYSRVTQDPQVLCNFGVLTTGFDAPQTSAALIARPTKSLVLYSQMVGRATRGHAVKGNREAVVRTIVDTSLPGFGNLAGAFAFWDDAWTDSEIR